MEGFGYVAIAKVDISEGVTLGWYKGEFCPSLFIKQIEGNPEIFTRGRGILEAPRLESDCVDGMVDAGKYCSPTVFINDGIPPNVKFYMDFGVGGMPLSSVAVTTSSIKRGEMLVTHYAEHPVRMMSGYIEYPGSREKSKVLIDSILKHRNPSRRLSEKESNFIQSVLFTPIIMIRWLQEGFIQKADLARLIGLFDKLGDGKINRSYFVFLKKILTEIREKDFTIFLNQWLIPVVNYPFFGSGLRNSEVLFFGIVELGKCFKTMTEDKWKSCRIVPCLKKEETNNLYYWEFSLEELSDIE
jgi:hypothetical protein